MLGQVGVAVKADDVIVNFVFDRLLKEPSDQLLHATQDLLGCVETIALPLLEILSKLTSHFGQRQN